MLAHASTSLLFSSCYQLAGSDANKSAIVENGGMDRLIKLSARFGDDPSVLQEVSKNMRSLCSGKILFACTANTLYVAD